jgi:dihydroorotase-like cyclic amidohydrolase
MNHFIRNEELSMIQNALQYAQIEKKRVHIRGISTAEGLEAVREYYISKGYEDTLAKNYTLPPDEFLTVSVFLEQALWCEKDKDFLSNLLITSRVLSPIRSPRDLRSIQQALRMGIIMGIEVPHYCEEFLSDLLTKQILSPYQIGSCTSSLWLKH